MCSKTILLFICVLLGAILFFQVDVLAEQVARFQAGVMAVDLNNKGSEYLLSIASNPGKELSIDRLDPSIILLESPLRLVIDIPLRSKLANDSYTVSDLLVQRIRLGEHKEKTRMVFDLRGNKLPTVSFERDFFSQRLLFRISFGASNGKSTTEPSYRRARPISDRAILP